MPRVSSANAATLAARDLIEALQKTAPNAPFVKINDTHNEALISLAELFNIIPKSGEQQSTNIHNGCCRGTQEVSDGPNQVGAPLMHR